MPFLTRQHNLCVILDICFTCYPIIYNEKRVLIPEKRVLIPEKRVLIPEKRVLIRLKTSFDP